MVESGGLLIRYTGVNPYRGFESLPLRSFIMKRTLLALTLCATFLTPSFAAENSGRDARITNVTGKVYIRAKGLGPNEWVRAENDTPLADGDTIRTDAGAKAEVTMDGDSVVHLSENTELVADVLERAATRFFLALGSLTAKIRALSEPSERFYIKTPVAVAAVRGTELAVTYEGEEAPAVVGVFDEGQVVVETEGNEDVILNPNQETEIGEGTAPTTPQPLAKLLVNRPGIVHVRERVQFLKPRWQEIPAAKRREFRTRLLAKPRERIEFKRPVRLAPPKLQRRDRPNRPERQRRERP